MGVYARKMKLWLSFTDEAGERHWEPTPYAVGQEEQAEKMLAAVLRQVAALKRAQALTGEPAEKSGSTKAYGERWLRGRPKQGVATAKDEATRLRRHAWPYIGRVPLRDLRPHHFRDLVRALMEKESARGTPLAPRTVRHVISTLKSMLHEAVADELIDANPCVLKRRDLPKKVDADPTWRVGAIFTRGEVEQLISDERIPEDRRLLAGFEFLAGVRFGEASALRWRFYDETIEPLGRLVVASAFNSHKRITTSVKTEQPRMVPVHPTLAKMLAAWRLAGWPHTFGRPPQPDDLILPSVSERSWGKNRNARRALVNFHADLDTLGLRRRRQHDGRRTFVSLALANGARKEILRWVSHGPTGDVVDLYTTLPWETLCEEVAKLQIDMKSGTLLSLDRAANGSDTAVTPIPTERKRPQALRTWSPSQVRGVRDLNADSRVSPVLSSPLKSSENLGSGKSLRSREAASTAGSVTVSHIDAALAELAEAWAADRDREALSMRLFALLSRLAP